LFLLLLRPGGAAMDRKDIDSAWLNGRDDGLHIDGVGLVWRKRIFSVKAGRCSGQTLVA
jgi:hypothetical protein